MSSGTFGTVSERLGERSLRAVFWSGSDLLVRQGLRFGVTVLLAHLVSPEDFGTIAMLYFFMGFGTLFIDSGFGSALVQRQNTTLEEQSSVFFFNLGVGALVALLLAGFSPQVAVFFNLPALQPLTCVMALNVFLGAFAAIHTILLTKALDFRTQMKANVIAYTVSGVAAVILAWQGFGVWSLAAQILLATVVNVILLWHWHPWRPAARFSLRALRSLFGFGSYMVLSSLLNTIHERLYTLIIGRIYTARDLGFFSRAETTQQMPANMLSEIFGRVTFPVFSAAADDRPRLARGVRRTLTGIMMLNIPAMVGMAVVADPLVRTLFGQKWASSILFLQILCFAGALWPLHVINLNVLMAQGRSNLFFRIELAKAAIGIIALTTASLHSLLAIALSYVAVGFVSFLLNAYYTGVFLGYGVGRQILDVLPYAAVSTLMAACIWPFSFSKALNPAVLLTLQVSAGVVVYLGTCKLFRLAAFEEVWRIATKEIGLLINPHDANL
jgi:teichuronic acid exporter